MDATFTTDINGAFAVHQTDLDKLHDLLESRVGEVTVLLACSDGVRRSPNSWADFQSYENSETKEIVDLSMSARSDDYSKSVDLDFSRDGIHPLRLKIACPDEEFTNLKEDIVDILEGTRHKLLSRLFTFNYFKYFILTSMIIGTVFLIYGLFFVSYEGNDAGISISLFNGISLVIYILFWGAVLLIAIAKLRQKYLPAVYFAVGQGEKRYENWRNRWLFAMGVIGVAFGIIVTIGIVII